MRFERGIYANDLTTLYIVFMEWLQVRSPERAKYLLSFLPPKYWNPMVVDTLTALSEPGPGRKKKRMLYLTRIVEPKTPAYVRSIICPQCTGAGHLYEIVEKMRAPTEKELLAELRMVERSPEFRRDQFDALIRELNSDPNTPKVDLDQVFKDFMRRNVKGANNVAKRPGLPYRHLWDGGIVARVKKKP